MVQEEEMMKLWPGGHLQTLGIKKNYILTVFYFFVFRLINKLVDKVGPQTLHIPSGEKLFIFDAA